MKLVTVEEMRHIEEAANAGGHSYAAMMEHAGRNVAQIAMALHLGVPGDPVLILVGPGNNGGDGLVAARILREADHDVTLYIWKRDIKGDENFRVLKRRRRGIAILWADNDQDFAKLREELGRAGLVVDALLGTGVTRPIDGRLAALMHVVKEELAARRFEAQAPMQVAGIPRFPLMEAQSLDFLSPKRAHDPEFDLYDPDDPDLDWDDEADDAGWSPRLGGDDWLEDDEIESPWPPLAVLAVDCPSGLNCDTGALDPAAIPADLTVTFAYPKWGHLQYPGAGACGLLSVADIGIPAELSDQILVELVDLGFIRHWLPARPPDAHKGSFGRAMIAAGSAYYPGAALLSATAAGRAGAGLVTLAVPSALHPALASGRPEATWLPLPGPEGVHTAAGASRLLASLAGYDALLVGPGLSTSEDARAFVAALTEADALLAQNWQGRIVLDADALNILAGLPDWPQRLPLNSILTPHPGEMARLIGGTPAQVNAARIQTAQYWSAEWGHVVLLKGPHTVLAAPDGRVAVLPFAVPALATAGSGDVLAGAIVAMLAQGLPAFEAAMLGAYLHGQAGAILGREVSMSGVLAGDFADSFPRVLKMLYLGS